MRAVYLYILMLTFQSLAFAIPCSQVLDSDGADRVLQDYIRSGEVMSQELLNQIIDAKLKQNPEIYMGTYQTSVVRVAIKIDKNITSVRQLPPELVKMLNLADNSVNRELPYTDEYMSQKRGDYIVFQIDSKGVPDFYIAPRDSIRYEERSSTELDHGQFAAIKNAIQQQAPNVKLDFIGILNPQIIDVFSASQLGIKRDQRFLLHASWGTSEKPVGQEAVFARRHGSDDGEVWKIKLDDGTGQPMNYRRVEVR